MNPILVLLQSFVAVLFTVSAVAKIFQPDELATALGATGFGETPIKFLQRTLPVVELSCAVGVLFGTPYSRRIAIEIAFALLVAFTGWMVLLLLRGRRVSCACFGSGQNIGPRSIIRNIALLSAVGLVLERSLSGHALPGLAVDVVGASLLLSSGLLITLLVAFRAGRSAMTLTWDGFLTSAEGEFS